MIFDKGVQPFANVTSVNKELEYWTIRSLITDCMSLHIVVVEAIGQWFWRREDLLF